MTNRIHGTGGRQYEKNENENERRRKNERDSAYERHSQCQKERKDRSEKDRVAIVTANDRGKSL